MLPDSTTLPTLHCITIDHPPRLRVIHPRYRDSTGLKSEAVGLHDRLNSYAPQRLAVQSLWDGMLRTIDTVTPCTEYHPSPILFTFGGTN